MKNKKMNKPNLDFTIKDLNLGETKQIKRRLGAIDKEISKIEREKYNFLVSHGGSSTKNLDIWDNSVGEQERDKLLLERDELNFILTSIEIMKNHKIKTIGDLLKFMIKIADKYDGLSNLLLVSLDGIQGNIDRIYDEIKNKPKKSEP